MSDGAGAQVLRLTEAASEGEGEGTDQANEASMCKQVYPVM